MKQDHPDFVYCERCGQADSHVERLAVNIFEPLNKKWLHNWCRTPDRKPEKDQTLNRWMLWLETKYNTSVFDRKSIPQIVFDIAVDRAKRGIEPPIMRKIDV